MTAATEEIRGRALALSSDDKLALADELYASVGAKAEADAPVLREAWKHEIDRRLAEAQAGKTKWLSEEEFFASLDTALEQVRR